MQEKMKTFSHSGTTGDTFSSMVAVKVLGGGEVYLKLNNLENVIKKIGWSMSPNDRHYGRMTMHDYEIMREYMLHQPYIKDFKVWNGQQIDS